MSSLDDFLPTREQAEIRGSVINGQPYVMARAPEGFMSLDDAQDFVNHIQAAIDIGRQFLSQQEGNSNPPDES